MSRNGRRDAAGGEPKPAVQGGLDIAGVLSEFGLRSAACSLKAELPRAPARMVSRRTSRMLLAKSFRSRPPSLDDFSLSASRDAAKFLKTHNLLPRPPGRRRPFPEMNPDPTTTVVFVSHGPTGQDAPTIVQG